jgi:cell division protein FtsZ
MAEMGLALMGSATAMGENRAVEAAQKAISSPLLEDISIQGARGVLINITGGPDLGVHEINEAASMIQEEAHEDANIIFGAVIDEKLADELRITVIATGFTDNKEEQKPVVMNLSPVAPTAPPKSKKVVHLGTIVDDLEAPTWQRKKAGSDETEKVTLNNSTFQLNKNDDEDDTFDIPTFLRRQMD